MSKKNVKTNSKSKKINKKDVQSIKKLKSVFMILCAIVLILGILAIYAVNKNKKVDMEIPITKDNLESVFSINIQNLKKDKDMTYAFGLTNKQGEKINSKEYEYDLYFAVSDKTDVSLSLYKDDNTKELLKEKDAYKGQILSNKKFQEDIYKLVIHANKSMNKNSEIQIQIVGKEK